MRNMSFMLTTAQMRDKSKTVTRRMGWLNLSIGERVRAVEKCQGLKAGEKMTRIGEIEITNIWRERLRRMTDEPDYGKEEVCKEGFGDKEPGWFVDMFCKSHGGCQPDSTVTRIEFRHV